MPAVSCTSLVIHAAFVGLEFPFPDATPSAVNRSCIAVCGAPDKPSAVIALENVTGFTGCRATAFAALFGPNVQLPAATAGA